MKKTDLKHFIKQSGVSIVKISEKLGKSRETVYDWIDRGVNYEKILDAVNPQLTKETMQEYSARIFTPEDIIILEFLDSKDLREINKLKKLINFVENIKNF